MITRRALATAAGWCATTAAAQDSDSRDSSAVREAVRRYYLVWEQRDLQRYRTLVTADYVLLEHGQLMNVEDDIRNAPRPGTSRTDFFDFRDTKVAGDTAYAYWFLDSDIDDEKGARRDRWLESAVLLRSKGTWLVALLHSTRIEKR